MPPAIYTFTVVASMVTPYGTTSFERGDSFDPLQISGTDPVGHWIMATDPLGGKERVEYRNYAPDFSDADPTSIFRVPLSQAPPDTIMVGGTAVGFGKNNDYMNCRNTFYWTKKMMLSQTNAYSRTMRRRRCITGCTGWT